VLAARHRRLLPERKRSSCCALSFTVWKSRSLTSRCWRSSRTRFTRRRSVRPPGEVASATRATRCCIPRRSSVDRNAERGSRTTLSRPTCAPGKQPPRHACFAVRSPRHLFAVRSPRHLFAVRSPRHLTRLFQLVVLLRSRFHYSSADAAAATTSWSGTCYVTAILGAVVADRWLGRFRTIALGSFLYFLGVVLLCFSPSVFSPPVGADGLATRSPDSRDGLALDSSLHGLARHGRHQAERQHVRR
jgi:hypothetical protein